MPAPIFTAGQSQYGAPEAFTWSSLTEKREAVFLEPDYHGADGFDRAVADHRAQDLALAFSAAYEGHTERFLVLVHAEKDIWY
jgi:hypothetical protein